MPPPAKPTNGRSKHHRKVPAAFVQPSAPVDAATVAPEIASRRNAYLQERQAQLEDIVDRHDDLVREAFHLEKFVILTSYDPKVAKQDNSNVFQQFRAPYDLVAQSSAGSFGETIRKTRRAVHDRRETLNFLVPPVLANKGQGKGRSSIKIDPLSSPPKTPSQDLFPRTTSKKLSLSSSSHVNGGIYDADEDSTSLVPVSVKRGPGRPSKRITEAESDEVSVPAPDSPRRKPGRPPKVRLTLALPVSLKGSGDPPPTTAHTKRGPGRPRNSLPAILDPPLPSTSDPAPPHIRANLLVKRGPGRPPRRSLGSTATSEAKVLELTNGHRGPGRLRPTATSTLPSLRVTASRALKHKATNPPDGPQPALKRIKLFHRPPRAQYTNPRQIPPPFQYDGSLPALLNSYISLDSGIDVELVQLKEMAKAEATTRNRIDSLRVEGRLLDSVIRADPSPQLEPSRIPDYHDSLVIHALDFSKNLREEHKIRLAATKRISKMIAAYFERVAGAEDRNRKLTEKRLRALAKTTMKSITNQWKLAVLHIRERQREVLKAEEARLGKKHLDAILEQSGQMLEAQQVDLSRARSRSPSIIRHHVWGNSHSDSDAEQTDIDGGSGQSEQLDQEVDPVLSERGIVELDSQKGDSETEGFFDTLGDQSLILSEDEQLPSANTTTANLGSSHELGINSRGATDDEAESQLVIRPAQSGLNTPISNGFLAQSLINRTRSHSPVLPSSPLARLSNLVISRSPLSSPPPSVLLRPSTKGVLPTNAQPFEHDSADVDFEVDKDSDQEETDRGMEAEMEAEEQNGSDHDSELEGLGRDANIPIEELLRQYGYPADTSNQTPPANSYGKYSEIQSSAESRTVIEPLDNDTPPGQPLWFDNRPPSPRPSRRPISSLVLSESVGSDGPDMADVDVDFNSKDESDHEDLDKRMEDEMDAGDDGDDDELDHLNKDADVPLEELLKQYGYCANPQGLPGALDSDSTDQLPVPSGVHQLAELDPLPKRSARTTPIDAASENQDEGQSQTVLHDLEMQISPLPEDDGKIRPPFLLRGTLRPYQQSGLEWLVSLYGNGLNGILADEMGLGKTIQTISLLGHLACNKGIWGPHLIIVPTSVLLNWEMEFKKFLPGFKILTYFGNPKQRKERRVGWNTEHAFNVCITSYTLALSDAKIFRRKAWHYMILDEAHMIKNFKSQRWQTMLGFKSYRRLLLTGTPLQNNLTELWSLLYFLMTGVSQDAGAEFANHKEFGEWFSNPVEKAIEMGTVMDDEMKSLVNKLHTVLRPYLLRRLKSDVEKELPAKYEHLVYCRLSKRQRFLYDEFMSRAQTQDALASGVYQRIANILMQLRKVCNHPDLFEVRPVVTSFAMTRSAIADYEIKELLVRRRLLAEDDSQRVNWKLVCQVTSMDEPNISVFAARSREALDASANLPFLTDQPGEPPPIDTRTIEGYGHFATHRTHTYNIGRWKQIAYVNRWRCGQEPILGRELIACLRRLYTPLVPLSVAELDVRGHMDRVQAVPCMIKSYMDRAEESRAVVDRFAFVTPPVVARDMPHFALVGFEEPLAQITAENPGLTSVIDHTMSRLQIAFPDPSLIQYDCGKLQELAALLRERKAGGHRVLIFTQMTKILDILEIFLNFHGYRYLRLDGATKIEDRQIVTERFNIDERIFAFIASSRSGGVGINLTGADTVVFYDSDFNPQMDRQCEDRAHRIGQIRDVHIYRFIAQHTVEESMLRKANQKRSLDDLVIQKGQFDWRRLFVPDSFRGDAEEPIGEGSEILGSAGVDINSALETALAEVEDMEDANAARMAAAEAQNLEVGDHADFFDQTDSAGPHDDDHRASQEEATENLQLDPDEEEAEEEEEEQEGGTVSDYMITFVERDWEFFSSWKV